MTTTVDAVCRGLLHLEQPAKGYRFNLDSVLLGAFSVTHLRPGLVVDAGAGCGVVGLFVAASCANLVVLLERQKEMARLAAANVKRNNLPHALVVEGDFRSMPLRPGTVSLLACNPPYIPPGSGRPSPNMQRTLSHQALHGGGQELLDAAADVLSDDGVVTMVLPVRHAVLLRSNVLHRMHVLALRPSAAEAPSRMLMAWSRKRGACVEDVRTVHEGKGFAPWADAILEGRVRTVAP